MPLDLSKLSEISLVDKEVNPREIFNLLSEKDARYKYPRDVQSQVWERWMSKRNERDLVVKMNTGGGKTVVGLLMLKSSLNEGVGPAVYITPDKYLTQQVLREAADLGIEVATDPGSGPFLQGRAILVTNIYQLINGRSVFGTSDTGSKIPIGALLIDDAHACLTTTESQFTLGVEVSTPAYTALLALFRPDLVAQNDTKLLELEAGAPDQEMLVPFWAWQAKNSQVAQILTTHRQDEGLKFSWPLIKNNLALCRCVFSAKRLEISPVCLPVEAIPSFTNAQRRVFLTATLADDSILVSDFAANPETVRQHITPNVANDIGDRMILIPQEIDPALMEVEIRDFIKTKSKTYNTVVIVPSEFRVEFWKDVADLVVHASNLEAAVDKLKQQHVGLVILVNKYDGIDLPGNACRILILDGLPQARRLYERIETNFLLGSPQIVSKQIQRIEQGMGRGVRANDDYCVVLLMGASLTKTIFTMGAKDRFSPATLAQIKMSEKLMAQLGGGLKELDNAMETCLQQGKEWKKFAKEAIANISYPPIGLVRQVATAQRVAFDQASIKDYKAAITTMQKLVHATPAGQSDFFAGWLKWQLAEYVQFSDPVQAQQILKAALQLNRRLPRTLEGIDYDKLNGKDLVQANVVIWTMKPYMGQANNLLVHVNGILDDLSFAPGNANEFEAAMEAIARFIGFGSQRPELEYKSGPDILWAVGGLEYFVIECKSGATVETVTKTYTNQLTGSMMWFGKRYDQSCKATAILIHPSRKFEDAASPHPSTRVITESKLLAFVESIRGFVKTISADLPNLNAQKAQQLLIHYRLTPDVLLNTYTESPK